MKQVIAENNEYVIWGAGRLGKTAYEYYKDYISISFYVDRDVRKVGKTLNGLPVFLPDALYGQKKKVIIAMKNHYEEVIDCLRKQFCIRDYVVFGITQEAAHIKGENRDVIGNNSLIICCCSGLGNQMFQYALYRNLKELGKKVYFDITSFDLPGKRKFLLTDVFPALPVKICDETQISEFVHNSCGGFPEYRNFQIYVEASPSEQRIKTCDKRLFDLENGIIKGYHQCYQYAQKIRNILLKEFSFRQTKDKGLKAIADKISEENAVSVHIRRGDYLEGSAKGAWGEVCTLYYYRRAMEYLKEKNGVSAVYFFSNDMQWVRENLMLQDAVYVEREMFDAYEDWYDMYLMSLCKDNIIANSSFSWWGAWLNRNPDKVVIAPKVWNNLCDYQDICPPDWVRI